MKDIHFHYDIPASICNIDNNTLHLWILNLGEIQGSIESLSENDKEEMRTYQIPREGKNFAARRWALKQILSLLPGIDPDKLDLEKGLNGKPYLKNSNLQFNSSHSSDLIAIAVNLNDYIGIDVEVVRFLPEMESIIDCNFCSREQDYINSCSNTKERINKFWEIWNRKEACIKSLDYKINKDLKELDTISVEQMNGWCYLNKNKVWVTSNSNDSYSFGIAFKQKISI